MAKFNKVMQCLQHGGSAYRIAWVKDKDQEIMMQIPQCIAKEIVPKMTSVQEGTKSKLQRRGTGEIEYHHQVIIISYSINKELPNRATYYIPTWEDIFADDWVLKQPEGFYIARMADEIEELDERHNRLARFMKEKLFFDLSREKQMLLEEQYDAMVLYSTKLRQRIEIELREQAQKKELCIDAQSGTKSTK